MESFKATYKIGDRIGGIYLVQEVLEGGMGKVYLCEYEQNGFVLKTFKQQYFNNAHIRIALSNEAQKWIELEWHPNIVFCFGANIFNNQLFLILERVYGKDLRGWLRQGPIAPQLALDFAIDICRGLVYANNKCPGIVHRDLKPENVLIYPGRRPIAKITDWGLAKVAEQASNDRVRSGSIVGTAPYMAPEQWLGKSVDVRTDIYAIGCILYEMLSGRLLFDGNNWKEYREKHLREKVSDLLMKNLPNDLVLIFERCLAKDMKNRYNTADKLLDELSVFYRQHYHEPPRFRESDMSIKQFSYFTNFSHGLISIGDFNGALRYALKAVEANPKDYGAFNNLGFCYYKLKEYDKAIVAFANAIKLDPERSEAFNNRANTYRDLARNEEAFKDYKKAIKLDPTQPSIFNDRAILYEKVGQHDQAMKDYNKAIQLDPTYTKAFYNRSNLLKEKDEYEKALRDLDKAIQLDPSFIAARVNRAHLYHRLNLLDEALAEANKCLEYNPEHDGALKVLGDVIGSMGKHKEALDIYTRLMQEGKQVNADTYYKRAYAHIRLSQFEEALADLNEAINQDKTMALALDLRGLVHAYLKDYKRARADFEEAIRQDPDFSQAYMSLGFLLYSQFSISDGIKKILKAATLGHPGAGTFAKSFEKLENSCIPKEGWRDFTGDLLAQWLSAAGFGMS